MPMKRHLYPSDWPAISKRIRERDGDRCKACRVANGAIISRHKASGTFMLETGDVFDAETGERRGSARGSEWEGAMGIKVVLTVAHQDHNPSNNTEDNLAALCQMHHLRHDAAQHAASTRATRRSRLAAGELFPEAKP